MTRFRAFFTTDGIGGVGVAGGIDGGGDGDGDDAAPGLAIYALNA